QTAPGQAATHPATAQPVSRSATPPGTLPVAALAGAPEARYGVPVSAVRAGDPAVQRSTPPPVHGVTDPARAGEPVSRFQAPVRTESAASQARARTGGVASAWAPDPTRVVRAAVPACATAPGTEPRPAG
ncbi:hypothetical protein PL81_28885, partial [Streptomyces sp. RSD-27]